MPLQLRRCAPALFLALCLTSCGGGSEPDTAPDDSAASSPEPTTSEPTTSEPATSEPATSEPATSEPATSEPAESAATSASAEGVSQETEDAFFVALDAFVETFTRFEDRYQKAVDAKKPRDLLAAARDLRDGVFTFDSRIRALDLTAVQPRVNTLLDINAQIIMALDDVATTTSGQEAQAALLALPFRMFTEAFSEVAAAIRPQ